MEIEMLINELGSITLENIRTKIKKYQNLEKRIMEEPFLVTKLQRDLKEIIDYNIKKHNEYLDAINSYSNHKYYLIYDLMAEHKDVLDSLKNYTYIKFPNSSTYLPYLNNNYTREKEIEMLLEIMSIIKNNLEFMSTIDGYFIFTNDSGLNKDITPLVSTYIYTYETDGLVKIGKSNNPFNRYKTHKISNPSINNFRSYKVLNYINIESMLHNHFQHQRVNGEFFKVNQLDVENYLKENFFVF